MDKFLEKYDMQSSDAPSFIIIHTALSALLVSSTWYMCYIAIGQSSSSSRHSSFLHALESWPVLPAKLRQKTQSLLSSFEASANSSKAVQYFEKKIPRINASRLTVSYVEAKIGRLFFKPITVPGRIWLSYKGTKLVRRFRQDLAEASPTTIASIHFESSPRTKCATHHFRETREGLGTFGRSVSFVPEKNIIHASV